MEHQTIIHIELKDELWDDREWVNKWVNEWVSERERKIET